MTIKTVYWINYTVLKPYIIIISMIICALLICLFFIRKKSAKRFYLIALFGVLIVMTVFSYRLVEKLQFLEYDNLFNANKVSVINDSTINIFYNSFDENTEKSISWHVFDVPQNVKENTEFVADIEICVDGKIIRGVSLHKLLNSSVFHNDGVFFYNGNFYGFVCNNRFLVFPKACEEWVEKILIGGLK